MSRKVNKPHHMLNKGARGVQAKETVAFVGAWTLFCGPAAGVPNLYMVESVDSLKVQQTFINMGALS